MPLIENSTLILLLWAVIGYALGSVPYGMVLARLMGLGNLREIGSGNTGATNVLRTGSKKAAFATVLLDGGKGAVAVVLARVIAGEDAAQLAGLMAVLGHCFPVWLRFRGGKGVATYLGLMLALSWQVGLIACLSWLVVALLTRLSSFAAISAAAFATVWVMVFGPPQMFVLAAILTLLIYLRHSENIKRLRAGTEPKIGAK
ncbi:Acyl-phosphate:glycerol-3-phosphate O-acyltransferase PlsY (EC 2.3.1.n3) [hydrothermal vent metagenome]|uniref:Acyl-phosphate:glycerol-3-phosphate O-acyltransferase PlsY n=1 Tax=hydrothermal vent metagenome TaxID=652676 RepID=A0A3B0T711_9ZZZZ